MADLLENGESREAPWLCDGCSGEIGESLWVTEDGGEFCSQACWENRHV